MIARLICRWFGHGWQQADMPNGMGGRIAGRYCGRCMTYETEFGSIWPVSDVRVFTCLPQAEKQDAAIDPAQAVASKRRAG